MVTVLAVLPEVLTFQDGDLHNVEYRINTHVQAYNMSDHEGRITNASTITHGRMWHTFSDPVRL